MEQVLLVVQVIIAIGLIGMVLIQRSDSDGFGLGGGGSGLISGRSKANLMTRTTAILAGLFIINSLALSMIAAHSRAPSILETIDQQQTSETKGAPSVPLAGAEKKKAAAVEAEKPDVVKTPYAEDAKKDAVNVEKKPAGAEKPAEKKATKKPVVKPADETPAEADHNNE